MMLFASVSFKFQDVIQSAATKTSLWSRFLTSLRLWIDASGWILEWVYLKTFPFWWLKTMAMFRGRWDLLTDPNRAEKTRRMARALGMEEEDARIRQWMGKNYIYFRLLQLYEKMININRLHFLKKVRVEGLQHVDTALKKGQSVVILTAHFGYARLIKYCLETHGMQPWMIKSGTHHQLNKERRKIKTFSPFFQRLYQRFHVSRTVTGSREKQAVNAEFNVRPVVKLLQKPTILLVLGDGLRALHFVEMPFLGHTLPLPTGIMSIALSTRSVVCPSFMVDEGRFMNPRMKIYPPLNLRYTKAGLPEAEKSMKQFGQVFEQVVRNYPYLYKAWSVENYFEKRLKRSRLPLQKRYKR